MQESYADRLLELIAMAGEVPASGLRRIIPPQAYAKKVVDCLKKSGLIRSLYQDGLRSYRLTEKGKRYLRKAARNQFESLLNIRLKNNIRARERMARRCTTIVFMRAAGNLVYPDEKSNVDIMAHAPAPKVKLPAYYDALEIKTADEGSLRYRNSRAVGVLVAKAGLYPVYHTGTSLMKWNTQAELRLNAALDYSALGIRHKSHAKPILLTASEAFPTIVKTLLQNAGENKNGSLLHLDSVESLLCFPDDDNGTFLLRLFSDAEQFSYLEHLLRQAVIRTPTEPNSGFDGFDQDGKAVLMAPICDLKRIYRFQLLAGRQEKQGCIVCFDFLSEILREAFPGIHLKILERSQVERRLAEWLEKASGGFA